MDEDITVRVFEVHMKVYTVSLNPAEMEPGFAYFVSSGISSRLAANALEDIDQLKEVNVASMTTDAGIAVSPAVKTFKGPIISLIQLEIYSWDYLERSAKLNDNAAKLTEYWQSLTVDEKSYVRKAYYPSVLPSSANFTPGYGFLFSVEFSSIEAAIQFYEHFFLHARGAASWRSSDVATATCASFVGLEETEYLLEALKFATEARNKNIQGSFSW
ncbi:hypothetical protein BJ878DRAFT_537691 [Calycina marina]|uniref:Uncharacterized protein n=1 Tax=Calycina marina TaxID=1763456 RepID=A0A9P8CJK3_9HELO|nr:hypothetical protein BJ878DRAFT_537691 [Calycina marina]